MEILSLVQNKFNHISVVAQELESAGVWNLASKTELQFSATLRDP